MKSFIVFALFVAAAVAVPVDPTDPNSSGATILRYASDNIGVEGYNYGYETSNGIRAEETGQLVNVGTENEGIAVRGSFTYTGPDGVVYSVTYIADQNGFQPDAPHIPRA